MTGGERTRVAAYALCADEAGRVLFCRIAPSVVAGGELARHALAIVASDTRAAAA